LVNGNGGEAVRAWALARADESGVSERLADVLCQRIQGRRAGEGLEPELRGLLTEVRGQTLGPIIRDKLLEARARIEALETQGPAHATREALALLGVDSGLYAFIENVLDSSKREIAALTAERERLEGKLEDVLSSTEIKSEILR